MCSDVVKKGSGENRGALIESLSEFCELLGSQKEEDAIKDLKIIKEKISNHEVGSDDFNTAILSLIDTFDGEHELIAYTLHKSKEDQSAWTIADQLASSSTRVLSLAKRMNAR